MLGVYDALLTFTYECNGKVYNYGVSDLRYDIKCGLLVLETENAKQMEAEKQRPAHPSPLTKGTTTLGMKRTTLSTERTRRHAKKASKTAHTAKTAVTSCPLRQSGALAHPNTSASSSSSCAGAPWYSSVALRHIQKFLYGPLKKRAASSPADETAIFTLLGLGYQLGLDTALLGVLPAILRKDPSMRGEFGEMALKQFEAALVKHL